MAATITVVSEVANRRRSKRKDINKVGFMPWQFISAASLLTFGISVAFGLGFISTE
ncbi:hypothetical protein [Parasphingorhabdus sp.]|uniref:hypothetical protein n=1 Tax=Parasphingorhabdus sp. TaxID=2709688 RepID=UPI003297FB38